MKRLNKIVKYIDNNDIVADIGCDHGYLLKIAIENKKIVKGYAIDNKSGPLSSAKNNLSTFVNVEFILSDGLKNVECNDINCVVIAGMGGMLINTIISDSMNKFKNIEKIILCPHKNIDKVRLFLNNNGFKIIDEDIVYEDSKYYEVLIVSIGEQKLNDKELYFGPFLLKKRNELFVQKWKEQYDKYKTIENKINEIKMIEEVLYES